MDALTSHYFVDGLGFAASGATLLAFAQHRMTPMRLSAIAANVFFIAYGAAGSFYPVLLLHVVLLPLNVIRLLEQSARANSESRKGRQEERSSLVRTG